MAVAKLIQFKEDIEIRHVGEFATCAYPGRTDRCHNRKPGMLLLVAAPGAPGVWNRIVGWRGEFFAHCGTGAGWLLLVLLFMAAVLGLMRGAGKADNFD